MNFSYNYPPSRAEPIFENQEIKLLEITELAQFLSCTEKHIRNLVFRREIPFVKVGRLVRFNVGEIRSWLQERSHR
ncbi:MAG: helix-turn-helix domain-containing protein [Bdellovibrionota bacterium]